MNSIQYNKTNGQIIVIRVSQVKTGGKIMQGVDGRWHGIISVPNQPLPIVIEFKGENAYLSIPVQGLKGYPFNKIEVDESKVFLETDLHEDTLTFDGQIEDGEITGIFTQRYQSIPFKLSMRDLNDNFTSDQETLTEIEVTDGTMKGKMDVPEGAGSFPVVIMIAGSGPTDKDGNSKSLAGKNNSLKMVAESLVSEGIACIRYDKRGVGDNIGLANNVKDLRFADYIDDAAAWITYAKNKEEFSSIHVMGHSEGSLIGMAASNQVATDSFVSLSGPGRKVNRLLREQFEVQLSDSLLAESKDILDRLERGEIVESMSADLRNTGVFHPAVQPYVISWMEYDPKEEISSLEPPVLIINGTSDLQIPVSDAELLHNAKPGSELCIVEDMNHVLKKASMEQDANIATYTNPDLPLAKGLMDCIINFLK